MRAGHVDHLPGGIHLPPMLKPILIPALLLTAGSGALHAQTDYYARAGVMWASTLGRALKPACTWLPTWSTTPGAAPL